MSELSSILHNRHIAPYFEADALEVHLLFDDPDRHTVSPKTSERRRYDTGSTSHAHYDFTKQLPPSQKWSSVTECCVCKHKLAQSLALELLQQMHLAQHQRFVTAGAFEGSLRDQALFIGNGSKEPQVLQHLTNCSEEADMRIWLHCIHSVGTKKLVFSPDTDVIHIGMPLLTTTRLSECDIIVRMHPLGAQFFFLPFKSTRLPQQ